mmetsp:Transcript_2694/g.10372  ORF Transcript_2694/g.10372 Transcript_2694/m.10372 type:complete len:271 (+) Transcript_2694:974-1786(+)
MARRAGGGEDDAKRVRVSGARRHRGRRGINRNRRIPPVRRGITQTNRIDAARTKSDAAHARRFQTRRAVSWHVAAVSSHKFHHRRPSGRAAIHAQGHACGNRDRRRKAVRHRVDEAREGCRWEGSQHSRGSPQRTLLRRRARAGAPRRRLRGRRHRRRRSRSRIFTKRRAFEFHRAHRRRGGGVDARSGDERRAPDGGALELGVGEDARTYGVRARASHVLFERSLRVGRHHHARGARRYRVFIVQDAQDDGERRHDGAFALVPRGTLAS